MNDQIATPRSFVAAAIIGLTLTATLAGQTQPAPKSAPKAKVKPAPAAAEQAPKPPAQPAPRPTDLKIRARYTSDALVSESTTYYQGARRRVEFPGMVLITQCDQKQTIQLNDKSKRFMIQPLADAAAGAVTPEPSAPAKPKGGVITYTTTIADTGERQTLLGSEARHIKSTTVKDATPDACDKRASKIETDGWYIDLPVHVTECESAPAPQPQPAGASCADRTESKQSGDAKLGFAVASTMTTTEDKDVRTASMEVVDLKVTSLDGALFTIPSGYTQVKSQAELLSPAGDGGIGAGGSGTSLADALFGSLADGTGTVAPKKPGVLRIGVVDPANTGSRDVPASTLRAALVRSLSSVAFEAVPIQGTTAADLERDAQAKACDYILTSDLAELKASKPNKVGGLLKKATGDPSSSSEVYDARVEFKLFSLVDRDKPLLASNVKANSGGGFGVGSALHLATWAGTTYMTMGMSTMMGPMMGMNALSMGGLGAGGLGRMGMGSLMMGPGMSSAMSIMSQSAIASSMSGMGALGATSGLQRPAMDPALERTVSDACEKVGKTVTDELKKRKTATAQ